MPDVINGEP